MDRKVRVWANSRTARDNNTESEDVGRQNRSEGILDSDFFETYSLSFAI